MKNFYTAFKIKLVIAFIFTSFSQFNSAESTSNLDNDPEIDKVRSLIVDSSLNQILNEVKAQRDYFEHILDYLALLVYGEAAKFNNKEEIINYIKNTRSIIFEIKNICLIVHSPDLFLNMQMINHALCQNLKQAITKNTWQPVDPKAILDLTQKNNDETELEELLEETKKLLVINQKNLKSLENTVERFGLTYQQKMVRNIEDFYNTSRFYIEKHNLIPYLKYGALGAAVTAYAIYHSDYLSKTKLASALKDSSFSKLWNNRVAKSFKNVIGSAPIYMEDKDLHKDLQHGLGAGLFKNHPKYSLEVTNKDSLGLLGQTEWSLGCLANTESTPDVLIPGATLGWAAHEIMDDSKFSTFGLFLHTNPMLRMAAWTNFGLQIKNGQRYQSFLFKAKRYLKNKYEILRGKSSKKSQKPTNTFDDIIGLDFAKKEFEEVIDYIINPEKFERTGNKPAKGYLMVGAPRTGKSYIAKAICGEINARQELLGKPASANFISLTADEIMQNNFDHIMHYINNHAPCVVFIDEIDLLCLNRGNGQKENPLLSQILTHMSGFFNDNTGHKIETNKQVIFVAATNNPQNIDSALLKSGRFSKIIQFDYPCLSERITFMVRELNKRAITNLNSEFIEEISKELEGCSFEDLSLIISGAIQRASVNYMPVAENHFRSAIDEILKSILPQFKQLSEQENMIIASYQAGKALATILLTPQTKISTVTTKPINKKIESYKAGNIVTTPVIQHGGLFTYQNQNLLALKNEQDLRLECQILLAGHVAQELIMSSSAYTYRPEDQQAALILAKQIALAGENYEDLTPDLQKEILHKAHSIKNECRQAIVSLLNFHKETLNNLNQVLIQKQTLDAQEINNITGL